MQEGVLAAQGIGIYFVYRHAAYEHRLILLRKLPSFGVRLQNSRLYRTVLEERVGWCGRETTPLKKRCLPPPQKIEL